MCLKRICGLLFLIAAAAQAFGAQEQATAAEWITLGTLGGPNVGADQSQIANAVRVGGAVYLFDVGSGTRRQLARAGLSIDKVRGVFISHHHIDHTAELGPIIVSRWLHGPDGAPLPIYGPPGTAVLVNGLINAFAPTVNASFTVLDRKPLPKLESTVAAHDISTLRDPDLIFEDKNIRVSAVMVDHFQIPPNIPLETLPEALAFRVEAGGRSFVFSGDTGVSANLEKLAVNCDVLITEVVDPVAIADSVHRRQGLSPAVADSLVKSITTNHLSPREIGKLAAGAGVGKVVLTHFVPGFSFQPDIENYRLGIAPTFQGPVVLARDLDRF